MPINEFAGLCHYCDRPSRHGFSTCEVHATPGNYALLQERYDPQIWAECMGLTPDQPPATMGTMTPTDEQIDAAAIVMWNYERDIHGFRAWEDLEERTREYHRAMARTALIAAAHVVDGAATEALSDRTYILHEGYDAADSYAYFGPVPEDVDPFDNEQTGLWEQTGNVYLVYGYDIPYDSYINPWSVWLDPNSEEVTHVG